MRRIIKFPDKISHKKQLDFFNYLNLLNYFKKNDKKIIAPELNDLYRLYQFIILNKRTTVLEFGSGWSSLIIALALKKNRERFSNKVKNLRRGNLFELHILENQKRYLNITKKRNKNILGQSKFVKYFYSKCEMTKYGDKCFATQYIKLPIVNPDFIYLDGPDQFKIHGSINNFSTRHVDLMPMSCDILKFEHYLLPGTIILIDGRTANARFLKVNFQRNWLYFYDKNNDQNVFYLNEKPLGKPSESLLNFYKDSSA
jgi:hypothetical protein